MSTTADATVTITCPDWCSYNAETHASDLWTNEGRCIHTGILVSVEDPTGRGPEWSPWEPDKTIKSDLIPVGLSLITDLSGRPVVTPGIRLGDDYFTIEQIEDVKVELERAIALAKELCPGWEVDQ